MKILIHVPITDDAVERILAIAPGADVVYEEDEDTAVLAMEGVEILFGFFTPQMIHAGKQLKWIQTASAGMDKHLPTELIERDILVTNASGAHAVQVAEQAWALTMALVRSLPEAFRRQQAHIWQRPEVAEICGSTVGIVGMGGIGRRYARLARAFGASVLAVDVQEVAAPEGVDEIWEMGRLDEMISLSDILFIACPYTEQTEKLINAERLSRMRSSAFLVNTARGRIVDETALIDALESGGLAGAGLDVTEVEPLPDSSPLWDMDNVILTQHNAGASPSRAGRLVTLFCENLERFQKNEPLVNVVDKTLGFPTLAHRKQWDL